MELNQGFEKIWEKYSRTDRNNVLPRICACALAFDQWARERINDLGDKPDPYPVFFAMVELQDRYFEWRSSVPKQHRDRPTYRGRSCILTVWRESYKRLRFILLCLKQESMLFSPPPALVTPRGQLLDPGDIPIPLEDDEFE